MINPNRIADYMKPLEYRFNKYKEFTEDVLPLTKYDDAYIVVRQYGKDHGEIYVNVEDPKYTETRFSYHYYVINSESQVVGRFDVCGSVEHCGITYHIIEEFQNRGIGQAALGYIVDRIFERGANRITILAVNERSVAIALKVGVVQKSKRVFEMRQVDYQRLHEERNKTIK